MLLVDRLQLLDRGWIVGLSASLAAASSEVASLRSTTTPARVMTHSEHSMVTLHI